MQKKKHKKKQAERVIAEKKASQKDTTERIVRDVTQEPNIIDSSSRLFVNTRAAVRDAGMRFKTSARDLKRRLPRRAPKKESVAPLQTGPVETVDVTPVAPRKQTKLAPRPSRFRAACATVGNRMRAAAQRFVQPITDAVKNHLASLTEEQYATAKSILSFLGVLCVVMIPLTGALAWGQVNAKQAQLTAQSEEAFSHIIAGQKTMQSLDFANASKEFGRGKEALSSVDEELSGVNRVLLWIGQWIPGKGKQAYAASRLIRAGELLAGDRKSVV